MVKSMAQVEIKCSLLTDLQTELKKHWFLIFGACKMVGKREKKLCYVTIHIISN
jgi:hypothetical protein